MKIGYIISDDPRCVGEWFGIIKYDDYVAELHKPCLFIGMDRLSEFLGEPMNVSNRQLDDDRYYTFTKFEYRKYHESDLYDFKKRCYDKLISGITYYFVDPLLLSDEKYTSFMNRCLSNKDNIVVMSYGDMYYVYMNNTVLGFNKNFQDIISSESDIFDTLISEAKVSFKGEDYILKHSEHLEMIDYGVKYLPYLYSIEPTI